MDKDKSICEWDEFSDNCFEVGETIDVMGLPEAEMILGKPLYDHIKNAPKTKSKTLTVMSVDVKNGVVTFR